MSTTIEQTSTQLKLLNEIFNYISKIVNKNIILLRQKEVIQWLIGDLSFLKDIDIEDINDKKILKNKEYKWILDNLINENFTKKEAIYNFSENIIKEIYTLKNINIYKPSSKCDILPDLETDFDVIKIISNMYYNKIINSDVVLNIPFAFRNIPSNYQKPLKIICMGETEKKCREKIGILNEVNDVLIFYKEMNIEYIGIIDLLKSLL